MKKIDWMYHRKGCNTCQKAQEFLARAKIVPAETADAKKSTRSKADALKLALNATKIIATKGRKVITVDVAKEKPGADFVASLIVGPSGNLRAPAAWIGSTLLVGFNEEMYKSALA